MKRQIHKVLLNICLLQNVNLKSTDNKINADIEPKIYLLQMQTSIILGLLAQLDSLIIWSLKMRLIINIL